MTEDKRNVIQTVTWTVTLGLVVLTRVFDQNIDLTLLTIGGALVVFVLVLMSLYWKGSPQSLKGWVFPVSLLLLLIPPSGPGTTWVASWPIAVLYVITVNAFYRDTSIDAPRMEQDGQKSISKRWMRFVPFALAAVAMIMGRFLLPVLPLRTKAVFEWQTAFEPLAILIVITGIVLPIGLLRSAISQWRTQSETNVPDGHPFTSREVETA